MICVEKVVFHQCRNELLGIRSKVFIEEQGVPEALEVDDQDPVSHHLLLFDAGQPVATGRLTPNGHIGRLAVLKPYRQRGHGATLLSQLEALAKTQGLSKVKLAAQLTALPFYQKRGYLPYGGIFMDAGIEHRMMKKELA